MAHNILYNLAGGRGFEPRSTGPEPAVLPLYDPPVIETFAKRPLSESALIWPISASSSNFIPLFGGTRNILYIPVVEIFAFLDLDQN